MVPRDKRVIIYTIGELQVSDSNNVVQLFKSSQASMGDNAKSGADKDAPSESKFKKLNRTDYVAAFTEFAEKCEKFPPGSIAAILVRRGRSDDCQIIKYNVSIWQKEEIEDIGTDVDEMIAVPNNADVWQVWKS